MRSLALLSLLVLSACSVGIHYPYPPSGPHPQVNVAGAIHAGPIEVLHSPISNAKPVTDITVVTVNKGTNVGHIRLSTGAGWQLSRLWGACDSEGFNCEMTWSNGPVATAGLTYRDSPLRADLRAFYYSNTAIDGALVFLLGFDL